MKHPIVAGRKYPHTAAGLCAVSNPRTVKEGAGEGLPCKTV